MDAQTIGAIAAIATAAIAALALVLAWIQLRRSHEDHQIGLAKGLYRDYLRLAYESPQFSSPSYPRDKPGYANLVEGSPTFERYEWYVAHFLFTAEEILDLETGDEWSDTLKRQVKYHALYLKDHPSEMNHYREDLQKLVKEAVAEYAAEPGPGA